MSMRRQWAGSESVDMLDLRSRGPAEKIQPSLDKRPAAERAEYSQTEAYGILREHNREVSS